MNSLTVSSVDKVNVKIGETINVKLSVNADREHWLTAEIWDAAGKVRYGYNSTGWIPAGQHTQIIPIVVPPNQPLGANAVWGALAFGEQDYLWSSNSVSIEVSAAVTKTGFPWKWLGLGAAGLAAIALLAKAKKGR